MSSVTLSRKISLLLFSWYVYKKGNVALHYSSAFFVLFLCDNFSFSIILCIPYTLKFSCKGLMRSRLDTFGRTRMSHVVVSPLTMLTLVLGKGASRLVDLTTSHLCCTMPQF